MTAQRSDVLIAARYSVEVYRREDGTYYAATTTEPENPAAWHGTGKVRRITELGGDRDAALAEVFGWEGQACR